MRKILTLTFGCLFVASVVAAAVVLQLHARDLSRRWDPQKARSLSKPIPVRTVKAKQRDAVEIIGGTAVTVPSATASMSLSPRSDHISDLLVEAVSAKIGDVVQKDQTLIKFSDELFAATVAERHAALNKERYEYESFTKLQQEGGISELEWHAAEMAVATAELRLKLAEYELRACTVCSPLDGVLESMHVVPGMRITSGTMLAVVHQLDPIHVQMDYPTERLNTLRLEQEAEVVLDAFPGEKFSGKVLRIATTANTRTRVLPVTIAIANPENRIRAGVSGYVRIRVKKNKATTVPEVSVIERNDRAMVFCVENGRAKIREIQIGPTLDVGEVQVVQGLNAGEEVVVFGHDSLRDNDVVNADWKNWTNRLATRQP